MRFLSLILALTITFTINPTFAQSFQNKVQGFISAAEKAAVGLDGAYDEVVKQIKAAKNKDDVEARLKKLGDKIRQAADSYGEQSPLWKEHAGLVSFVKERQQNALERFEKTGKTAWQERNARWKQRGEELQTLRVQIISEADRANGLSRELNDQIELVLDAYLEEGVQAAIDQLKNIKSNLKALNDNVEGALNAAKAELLPSTGG